MTSPDPDPFDTLLNLEQTLYATGHRAGIADGSRAGLAEGRSLGLEHGFDKFADAGRLYGKAVVWANRLPAPSSTSSSSSCALPPLLPAAGAAPGGARLARHIGLLHALVAPASLAVANSDAAVAALDERVRRARGTARVVERQAGQEAQRRPAAAALGGVPASTTATGKKGGGGGARLAAAPAPAPGGAAVGF